jgi:hypothetical protein
VSNINPRIIQVWPKRREVSDMQVMCEASEAALAHGWPVPTSVPRAVTVLAAAGVALFDKLPERLQA